MAKKSNNKKQQAKQDRSAPKAKGAKGAVTSKGSGRRSGGSGGAQSAVLRDAVDAARESAEVLREAASVLSQSAAQSAAQTVAQARWGNFPGQNMGFAPLPDAAPLGAVTQPLEAAQPMAAPLAAQPAAVAPMQPAPAPVAAAPAAQPVAAHAAAPQPPAAAQPAVQQTPAYPQPLPQVQPMQAMQPAPAPAPVQQPSQPMAPVQAPLGSHGLPYGDPRTLDPYQEDPLTRVSHNASMGEQVGFSPKEPEQKKRWGSPIKSLKSAMAALTNSAPEADPQPQPQPEAVLPRTQIDYTPKPELLNNLPKFGDAPAVLPTPQELLASVPAISTTGQIVPTGDRPAYAPAYGADPVLDYYQPDPNALPAAYGDIPSFSVEMPSDQVPPIQEQVIEVPAQEVVYGEIQVPDPYLQAYDSMQMYDPSQMQMPMHDPSLGQPYDPMQMQVYDPAQAQHYDPYGQQQYYGAPDPYGAPEHPYDPAQYGHGFDQGGYDPYGYGAGYDPYAADPNLYGAMVPVKGGKATASLILGILSILLAFIPPLGLVLAVVAILLAKSYHKKGGMAPRAGTGRVCGIVGIILSLILAVAIGVFLAYFYGGLYGESNAGAIMGYLQTTPLKAFL